MRERENTVDARETGRGETIDPWERERTDQQCK